MNEGIEVSSGNKKFAIWGSNILSVLQFTAVCILAYAVYRHDVEAAERNKEVVQAVKEQTVVQREQLNAQREGTNCIARLTAEQRKQSEQLEFCRNLGRGR